MTAGPHRSRRRVLVTGGAGFIGSHLVARLEADGADLLIVDDLSTGHAENLSPSVRLERQSILSTAIARIFEEFRPEVVVHLAAQASVPVSMTDPLRDLDVNVVGPHRVAAAAAAAGTRRLVFVSSAGAVYGEHREPATERSVPHPASYYGVHKLAAEGHIALAGLPHAIVRPSNVYGPRQAPGLEGAVVASFVVQAAQGRLVIHGDGGQTRNFVHVRDLVDAITRLAQAGSGDGVWNVAGDASVSIAELADLVETTVGRTLIRATAPPRPGDVRHSAISAARLQAIGWAASTTLSEGLAELAREVASPG